jgi:hypothetical protein
MHLDRRANCLAAEPIRFLEQWMHQLILAFAAFVSFCEKEFSKNTV